LGSVQPLTDAVGYNFWRVVYWYYDWRIIGPQRAGAKFMVNNMHNPDRVALRPVSPLFRFDWNYAHRVAQTPVLGPASLLISLMPILKNIRLLSDYLANIWVLWTASVLFLLGILILKIRIPLFVKEYQYYAQFESRGHSHRWIVWEFYLKRNSLADPDYVVHETKDKLLSFPCDGHVDLDVCRVSPLFGDPTGERVEVRKPIQVDRDIYLPIRIDNQRLVLPMQESDPSLAQKQKELFWILLSQFAKERPISRYAVWILFGVAGSLYVTTVLNNVFRVAVGEPLFSILYEFVKGFAA
jgi:hypothetical protein